MNSLHPNIINLTLASESLKETGTEFVFVGGSTTILYVDDWTQAEPRATVDVDCVVEIISQGNYGTLVNKLIEFGWTQDTSEGAPICRWEKNTLLVDIMPTKEEIIGFSNIWYTSGFEHAQTQTLPTGQIVKVFSFPYFVASKLEALKNRGLQDLQLSQDFEDLLFVIEGRKNFFVDLKNSPQDVVLHAKQVFSLLVNNANFENAARGNLPRGLTREREALLIRQIKTYATS